MFNLYEPPVKATIAFLRLLKIKVNNATVNETLQNHPDWPSMLCINDSLTKWNIPNAAGKIDPNKIDELPTPFIAYTSDSEARLGIVTHVSDSTVQIYKKNYNKPITITKENFLKIWHGIYLIAEQSKDSGESNYAATKRKALIYSLIPATALILLILFSFLFLNKTVNAIENFQAFNKTGIHLQYFILLSGIFVTSLLLWHEIDKSNPVLQKVCTGIAKGNCDAILSSKQSKLFNWLSWSEVGFFYFSGAMVALLFMENIASSMALIGWLNILALPYTVFSIYYQWKVAKQWCVLCLAVQILLVLGSINVFLNSFLFPFPQLSFSSFIEYIVLYMLPVLLWYAVKPSLLRLQEAKLTKRQYLRIKFNTEIFETLLKKQKAINMPVDGLGIDLGNPAANNTIIKVCSPYCSPCAAAHPKIEEILKSNDNVKAKIIFTTPNDQTKISFKPVQHLLALAAKNNNEITHKALDDWYLSKTKKYETFAAKYKMNGELEKQGYKMELMDKWCLAHNIRATPTIFLNGHQLPDAYSIEDLQYFLLE